MKNDLTFYNEVCRFRLGNGDLLVHKTYGFVPSLIHLWSEYNHAGLVLAPKEFEGQHHRRWTLEAVAGGTRMAYLSTILENVHGEVWWFALKPEYDRARIEIMCTAMEYCGVTKYDLWNLFKYPFKAISVDLRAFLCSEYAFIGWKGGKIVEGDIVPNPTQLTEMGVTLPGVCIVKSEPEGEMQTVQP